jgi:hypothetical protein
MSNTTRIQIVSSPLSPQELAIHCEKLYMLRTARGIGAIETVNNTVLGKLNDNKLNIQYRVLLKDIDSPEGQKQVLITWDRNRSVIYNGEELQMNTYGCSSCNKTYKFEFGVHYFCPLCGTKYKFSCDVSI